MSTSAWKVDTRILLEGIGGQHSERYITSSERRLWFDQAHAIHVSFSVVIERCSELRERTWELFEERSVTGDVGDLSIASEVSIDMQYSQGYNTYVHDLVARRTTL